MVAMSNNPKSSKQQSHSPYSFSTPSKKAGKWSMEEEKYAFLLIEAFDHGNLDDCPEGTTLRAYLARKLNCSPMRISKKFAGLCIGKVSLINIFSMERSNSILLLVRENRIFTHHKQI